MNTHDFCLVLLSSLTINKGLVGLLFMLEQTPNVIGTRQIIRCRVAATPRQLQIKQDTASNENEGDTKPTATLNNFDKVSSGAPDGSFGKLFLVKYKESGIIF